MNHGYTISLRNDANTQTSEFSYRKPEEKAKDHMICQMITVSAKGIIDQVKEEEHLDIPTVTHIHGTLKRKILRKT